MSEAEKSAEQTAADEKAMQEKIASECQAASELGFVTQLKLQGKPDDEIKRAFLVYQDVQVKRASRLDEMKTALLSGAESKE